MSRPKDPLSWASAWLSSFMAAGSPGLDEEFYAVLGEAAWLESKISEGGTSLRRVREQLERARAALR